MIGFGTSLTTKYRTSVLNDFSVVTKAVIFIFRVLPAGEFSISQESYSYQAVEALPVQINPSEFERHRAVKKSMDLPLPPVVEGQRYELKGGGAQKPDDSLVLNLIFDIYDEHDARTMHGMSPESFSLADENIVIIEKLFQYSNTQSYFALFKWGNMNFFGPIVNVTCNYKCFSSKGEPLKAVVDVTIRKQSLGETSKGIEREPNESTLGTSWLQVEGYQFAESLTFKSVGELAFPYFLKANRL
ncbi:MAG: hypothetical protein LBJ32_00900 [Oscillospiraceae bacterium]|jgi:hypothetical protein|nr:hypothetical protein [Oscillospiraceae bacterium]